jgi:hypothetical protein
MKKAFLKGKQFKVPSNFIVQKSIFYNSTLAAAKADVDIELYSFILVKR